MVSHAANPFAVKLNDGTFRIYFTCRDNESKSHIGFVDVDFLENFKVVRISDTPVLTPGPLGMFDDSGVAMGYYILIDGVPHIYYLGWNLKVTVPWLNTIGLAKYNKESDKFEKVSKAPIMDRSNEDPFSISYPSILYDKGVYKMWYGSNLKWGKDQQDMSHVIKYAESNNGLDWSRKNIIVIDLMYKNEYAISKPIVVKVIDKYLMWYSYRGRNEIQTYRIGFAESDDGLSWKRKDNEAGINVSRQGWDSEMLCYPFVFFNNDEIYMLYNGNGYGKSGFGLAKGTIR